MQPYQLFVSVICLVRNAESYIDEAVASLTAVLADSVRDYELIIVDNASTDGTLTALRDMTQGHVPNVQVYALTGVVSRDTAAWYGIESALGDVFVVFDPQRDDPAVIGQLIENHVTGSDVVFARNTARQRSTVAYRFARAGFEFALRRLGGVDTRDAPSCRLMNRRVTSYIAQQRNPARSYRLLPATGGFVKDYVTYAARPLVGPDGGFWQGFDQGLQLLVSTTRAPMRFVSALSLFGATASLIYSIYVVVLRIVRDDLAQGWVSMSLMTSGMFFLISLVLLVLGEYVIHVAGLAEGGQQVHVSREFTSTSLTSRDRVNVHFVDLPNE